MTPSRATMAAAIITGPQGLEIRSVPLPEPARGQVRVRLEGCGVCASNLPVWQGRPYFRYPFEPGAPGHEAWGWIDATGPEVNHFHPGDRVALLSYHAYAQYDIASAQDVVALPDDLAQQPFPAEPLACAVNDIHALAQQICLIGNGAERQHGRERQEIKRDIRASLHRLPSRSGRRFARRRRICYTLRYDIDAVGVGRCR